MRLARLTGLEIEKLEAEIEEVTAEIGRLEEILGSKSLRMSVIKEELLEVAGKYGDDRRTEILDVPADFSEEDLSFAIREFQQRDRRYGAAVGSG